MQLETALPHGQSASRPRPIPVQNVLEVTSDDSVTSADSSTTSLVPGMMSPPEFVRCSRCQKTPGPAVNNMIQYGLNLWYCRRCAGMVGLINR